jgi:hypothetical protein
VFLRGLFWWNLILLTGIIQEIFKNRKDKIIINLKSYDFMPYLVLICH